MQHPLGHDGLHHVQRRATVTHVSFRPSEFGTFLNGSKCKVIDDKSRAPGQQVESGPTHTRMCTRRERPLIRYGSIWCRVGSGGTLTVTVKNGGTTWRELSPLCCWFVYTFRTARRRASTIDVRSSTLNLSSTGHLTLHFLPIP